MSNNHSPVVTRFAPSPTGILHIGGARTALFNWLFARAKGGKYLLRIEDTDKKRSTPEAVEAIIDGLGWLGLDWDGEITYQSEQQDRHRQVAEQLLAEGKAYRCYTSPEELATMRDAARARGERGGYDRHWRDKDQADAPEGVKPVIRIKAPLMGETLIHDLVQGEVRIENKELDDLVLLRADGTPTYMLSVVVDDHDMGITHIIRGDDHLTNAFRQQVIYDALGWPAPEFAHIPLIHGSDGAKLSKRHGALGVDAYREMGYLPAALRNHLLRLGWGHGDTEIIATEDVLKIFSLKNVGRGASRFDFQKLESFNAHYMRAMETDDLAECTRPFLEAALGRPLRDKEESLLKKALPGLTVRAKTLVDLATSACFYFWERPLRLDEKAQDWLNGETVAMIGRIVTVLDNLEPKDIVLTLGAGNVWAFGEKLVEELR